MTSHFELSIITGTALMSGSVASRRRNRDIASAESSIASSMFTSISWAPASTCWRATSTASSKRSSRISFANFREPVTFVRSPTFTNTLPGCGIASGSRPDSRVFGSISGSSRGGRPATASAIALTWAGVVPQQPPAMLTQPVAGEPAEDVGHRLGRVVVAAELVRQPGVRVDRDGKRGDARQVRDVRPQRRRARARS